MGKESRLRNREQEHPYVARDGNGKKLPYDPDRVPDGLDDRIWHLALYFEQKMESNQVSCPGRPILYVALSRRLDSTGLGVLRAQARTCGIPWLELVEKTIDTFISIPNNILSINSVHQYTEYETFQYCLQYVIDSLAREQLITEGTQTVVPQPARQLSKRTEKQKTVDRILLRKLSEDEMMEKMREFRNRESEQPST